jgi:hypothetical protein
LIKIRGKVSSRLIADSCGCRAFFLQTALQPQSKATLPIFQIAWIMKRRQTKGSVHRARTDTHDHTSEQSPKYRFIVSPHISASKKRNEVNPTPIFGNRLCRTFSR